MRVLIELDGRRERVEVDGWASGSTLGDFVAATIGVRLGADTPIAVDTHRTGVDTPLRDLVLLEGSRIAHDPVDRPRPVDGWTVTLAGGLDAGAVVAVPRNRELVIGRAPQADLVLPTESASWEHCTVEFERGTDGAADGVRIRDAGSTNGTVVSGARLDAEGVLVTGATSVIVGGAVLLVRPTIDEVPVPAAGTLPNLTPAATAPYNRPPRPGRRTSEETVSPPSKKDVPAASKFSFITVLAPLVLAGAMVLLLGDARFALFALLSPVTAIGMWFEQKHRRSRNLKDEDKRFAEAVDAFRGEIAATGAVEAARRQELVPDPATVVRRAALPTTLLWQRRTDDDDFLGLHAGTGDAPWRPEVDERAKNTKLEDDVKAALDDSRLTAAPVVADLSDAGVVGIVGDRTGALALARSLLAQAAVHCGPADLTVGVFCDGGRETDWSWASWLPHTRVAGSSTGERWMSAHREQSTAMLRGLRESVDELPTPNLLVVIDSEVLTEGRDAPARSLLGVGRGTSRTGAVPRPGERRNRVSGIVIATNEQQLPAACTSIITVGADAAAVVDRPEDRTRVEDVVLAGISTATAERCAMDLAHFDDPELTVPGASLPSLVRLPDLVPSGGAQTIRDAWDARTGVSTPIGSAEDGPMEIDLVRDGPHGLVGGTTGSGKSEFLRSFVAGLAARNDPTRLNFLLIDFKGGAAFAACERLPHTIGTISNLDEQLADRALRALEAEMERRQRVFAAAGADIDNLDAYLRTDPAEPMPRLLLVVDEFAMLAKDFPDVLTSLVSIAAVGRTLGVHMILATQRPAGVVSEDILANTNLRVALRVQSREDSTNVIGVPAAAGIGRQQTGRAYVKLGQDDITPVQTALVTGRARDAATEQPVTVRETSVFGVPVAAPSAAPSASDDTDFDVLIEAVQAANDAAGYAPPRPIWPEALGARVDLATLPTTETRADGDAVPDSGPAAVVPVALADDPDRQRQITAGWDLDEGNLMLMGIQGSGTSTALSSIALALADGTPPEDLDLLVLDMGAGDLRDLARLPHTTAYVGTGAGAAEEQARFLRHLRTELDRRRATPGGPRTVVLLDGLATLRDEYQDYEGQALLDMLYRVYAEGPALGIHTAVSTTRAKAVPSAMDEVTTQKWLFRLADPYDYASIGVRQKEIPAPVPGRFVSSTTKLQSHIATPAGSFADAVRTIADRWATAAPKSQAVRRLPDSLHVAELRTSATFDTEPWRIPIGIAEDDLSVAALEVYDGEHVLVTGPARSGRSTTLLAIAESARTASGVRPAVWAICDRRSPLADAGPADGIDRVAVGADQVPALVAGLRLERGPVMLLVDDAERFEDGDQSFAGLLGTERPGLCVVAAGRNTDLRSLYGHWTKRVAKARCGILLQPDVDYDGDLLGAQVPRRSPVALTQGRGYAVTGGRVRLVQTAQPGPATSPVT